jgi:hypothetical protein
MEVLDTASVVPLLACGYITQACEHHSPPLPLATGTGASAQWHYADSSRGLHLGIAWAVGQNSQAAPLVAHYCGLQRPITSCLPPAADTHDGPP